MSGTDDPTHVYWDLENRKGLWAKGEAMTDDLPQIKARLEEYACGWDGDDYKLVTDVRAALQRMEGLEERLRQICCGCGESALTHRIDYGQPSVVRQESDDGACGLDQCGEWLWVGADKELVALRQRVEEAEHKEYLQFERAERLHQRVEELEAGENECCDCYDAARDEIGRLSHRVEELERENRRITPTAAQEVWRAEANRQSKRAEAAEAELARVVEAGEMLSREVNDMGLWGSMNADQLFRFSKYLDLVRAAAKGEA